MTKYIGRRVSLGLARETSRGTAVAPAIWMRHMSQDFDETYENISSEAGVGRLELANQSHQTKRMSEGTVEGELGSESFGLILYSLLGSLSTSADTPVAGAHSHAFSLAQTNQHPMLALTKQDPDKTQVFDVMPNSTTITVTPGEIVTHSTDFMGLKANSFTTQSVSYPDELKFLPRNMSFKVAANIAGIAAATPLDVKEASITITQNTAYDDKLGSLEPNDVYNQAFDVTGEITLNNDDATEVIRGYARDNTNRSIELKLTSDGYITGTTPATLTIQLPKCRFFEWEVAEDLDELTQVTIQFQGMYDMANSQASITTCTLVNGESGSNY